MSEKRQGVFPLLYAVGVFSAVTILFCVFWLTARLDEVGTQNSITLNARITEQTVEQLIMAVTDYAYWDLAYELVMAGDDAAVYEHLGSGAVESTLFDQLVILSPENQTTYDFTPEDAGTDALDPEKALKPFLSALAGTEPGDYEVSAGFAEVNGVYAAVAATRITPDYH